MENVSCHFQREVGLALLSHWVDRAPVTHSALSKAFWCLGPLRLSSPALAALGGGKVCLPKSPAQAGTEQLGSHASEELPCVIWKRKTASGAEENISWKNRPSEVAAAVEGELFRKEEPVSRGREAGSQVMPPSCCLLSSHRGQMPLSYVTIAPCPCSTHLL